MRTNRSKRDRGAAIPALNRCWLSLLATELREARGGWPIDCAYDIPGRSVMDGNSGLGTFIRICGLFTAVMLGTGGAFFTYASFDDPVSAVYAVVLLLPSVFLLAVLPDKPPGNKRRRGRVR